MPSWVVAISEGPGLYKPPKRDVSAHHHTTLSGGEPFHKEAGLEMHAPDRGTEEADRACAHRHKHRELEVARNLARPAAGSPRRARSLSWRTP